MTQDTKNPLGPSSPHEDMELPPPSYDSALAHSPTPIPQATAGPSTTQPQAPGDRVIPEHLTHLFTGAPNAEPLLGRNYVPPEQIKAIQWHHTGKYIESWDPKLSDPAVLYDYLRAQAMTPPSIKIRCCGMHTETIERSGTVWENGRAIHKTRGETQNIVDFDFTIDLSDIINHPNNMTNIQLHTFAPDEPTQRGTHLKRYAATYAPIEKHRAHGLRHRHQGYAPLISPPDSDSGLEFGPLDTGRCMSFREQRDFNAWHDYRKKKGIPFWVKMQDVPDFWESRNKGKAALELAGGTVDMIENAEAQAQNNDLERGTSERPGDAVKPNLREWCEAYCADKGLLKEFYLMKGIYGWDIEGIITAVRGAVLSTSYQSNYLTVSYELDPHTVVVRPSNKLSRALGNRFIYFLSWITLIYPLIWILKHFLPYGGAPYCVAAANYGMKFYPPVPSTYPSEDIQSASDRLAALYKLHPELPENPTFQYGPKGVHYLVGRKEGEWFREWEDRIRMGVRTKFRGELQGGIAGDSGAGADLDGY